MEMLMITHGWREIFPDPEHTDDGLLEMIRGERTLSLIADFVCRKKSSVAAVGEGRRFRETYLAYKEAVRGLQIKCSPLLGPSAAKIDMGERQIVILPDGDFVEGCDYIGLSDTDFDGWSFLKKELPDGAVLFSGREFARTLGFRSASCSVYRLDICNKIVRCMVKHGEPSREIIRAMALRPEALCQ